MDVKKIKDLRELIDSIGSDPWGTVTVEDIVKPLLLIVELLEETYNSSDESTITKDNKGDGDV